VKHRICLHHVSEIRPEDVPDGRIVARSASREDLVHALTVLRCNVLILDLDHPEAINSVLAAREVRRDLAIVGVTNGADAERIIEAYRAGCAQATRRPIDPQDLQTALQRALEEVPASEETGRILCVIAATGGAGATTVACQLAVELAAVSRDDTLLVDADFEFGGVARAFDVQPRFTLADLIGAGGIDAHNLQRSAMQVAKQTYILARPTTLEDAHAVEVQHIRDLLRTAQSVYPNVVLDLPRKLDPVTGCAIEMCDYLLVVTQLTVPSVDNAARLLELLQMEGIPPEHVRVVVNRFRKNVHSCTIEMAEKRFGQKVFGVVPNDYAVVHRAIDVGEPLPERHSVREAIREMARKLLPTQVTPPPASSGWLGRLGFGRSRIAPR